MSDDMADLRKRLVTASERLTVLRNEALAARNRHEFERLSGKVQGVQLALDYLRAYEATS